jgi:hypothetical protein
MTVMRTLHKPEPNVKPRDKCTGMKLECNKSHWFAIPAIRVRGTWNVMDMLSDDSIRNTLMVYNQLKGF